MSNEVAKRQSGAVAAPAKANTLNALAIMASRLQVAPGELERCLMDTAFKGASSAEFIALVAVANQYGLNPLMREIYAFPKRGGGIVPLVPIDGWLKLIRENDDFAGMDVAWSDEMVKPAPDAQDCPVWCETTIHHKSHPDHPTVHREWIEEMYRNTDPWKQTTKRMLEWKSIIQTGRIAFGLSGIKDLDEAERISDGEMVEIVPSSVKTVDPGIGQRNWEKLVKQADGFGYTEDDVLATAFTAGYEGNGPSMSEDLAKRLYAGMKANPKEAPEVQPQDQQAAGFPTPLMGDE